MLLKRLTAQFARRDWAAIAIEFDIVVAGVYGAFELDRWRESESERRINERFIELLHVELEENCLRSEIGSSATCRSRQPRTL